MRNINLKNIQCAPVGCGLFFTIPAKYNDTAHEHMQDCVINQRDYKEAVIEQQGNTTIVKCPKCGKEAMRVTY